MLGHFKVKLQDLYIQIYLEFFYSVINIVIKNIKHEQ